MNLYEAILCRRSIRKFTRDKISEKLLQQIKTFSMKATALNEQIGVEVEIIDNTQRKIPVKGFGKLEAPYYLVFYSEEAKGYERNAGYIMEQIVLYMTEKGLGCCYWGSGKLGPAGKNNKKRVMAIAFGCADGKLYREASMAKRLPLSELCIFKEEVSEQIKTVLKAARLAPSALNSQPWRFIVYSDKIYIFSKKDLVTMKSLHSMREISLGIMLSHIMLAAEELWMELESAMDEQFAKKIYKNGEYVGTIILH